MTIRWPGPWLALPLLTACGGEPAPNPDATAAAAFHTIEQQLLGAPALELAYVATAEGAYEAAIRGTLRLAHGGRIALVGEGTFGGDDVAVRLDADAERVEGGSAQRRFAVTTPPALRQAVVLGLTRMGVLHNLARLTEGSAPDHADGGVAQWVQVGSMRTAPPRSAQGGPGLQFAIRVDGQPAGTATLWLDPRSGLPTRREQVVEFPSGEMRVVETYTYPE